MIKVFCFVLFVFLGVLFCFVLFCFVCRKFGTRVGWYYDRLPAIKQNKYRKTVRTILLMTILVSSPNKHHSTTTTTTTQCCLYEKAEGHHLRRVLEPKVELAECPLYRPAPITRYKGKSLVNWQSISQG